MVGTKKKNGSPETSTSGFGCYVVCSCADGGSKESVEGGVRGRKDHSRGS